MSDKTDVEVDPTADTVRCGGHSLDPMSGRCRHCSRPWTEWWKSRSSKLLVDKTDAYDARSPEERQAAAKEAEAEGVQLVGSTVTLEPLWAARLAALASEAHLAPGAYLKSILRQQWESMRRGGSGRG